ncbi:hypothetical protein JCM16358_24100 [Halanaerocella petrolearia]
MGKDNTPEEKKREEKLRAKIGDSYFNREADYTEYEEVAENVAPGAEEGDYTPENDELAAEVVPGVDMGDYNMPLDDVIAEDDTRETKAKKEINIAEEMDVDIDVEGYESVDRDITDEMDDDIETDYNSKRQ